MPLDLWEEGAQQIEPFFPSSWGLLIVLHGTLRIESPKTNFGMNLERPLLAIRRDRIVHLLDF
jgi:hypothetical protein